MNINRHQPVQVQLVIFILIAILPLSGVLPLRVHAMPETLSAPGKLDPEFDGDGKVITDFNGQFNAARAIAIQPDGKIVISSNSSIGFGLVRYNSDGSLDPTFGSQGELPTEFVSDLPVYDGEGASAMVLQPDGKIIVGGSTPYPGDFTVVRFNSDGSLDTSFDGDGQVTTDINPEDNGISIALQPDGKIILAGITSRTIPIGIVSYNVLIRYNPDGSLDQTFGEEGVVITDFGGRGVYSSAILLQPDGKLLLGSSTSSFQFEADFALARFDSDGTLDPSFGEGGKVIRHIFNSNEYCHAIALQPDGKIIAAGTGQVDGGGYGLLARFDPRGALDTTFGTDGKVVSDFGGTNLGGLSVATQPNGKILLGGDSFQGTHILFALERYNKNGSRDLTFGVDGRVATAFGSNGQAGSLVLQRDGKILQAGMSYFPATGFDIAMVRYLGDETLTVNKTADTDDGVCNSDCSLREAIDAASTGGTINFVPSLSGQTILLGSTLLIDKDVHIDGSGLTSQVTVSGNDRVPVLEIRQGTTVTINRLIVSNGYTEDWQFGAGLLNDGTLLITNSTIKDNVGREGGGIRNLGALEIVNSMVSNNSADNVGGGILNYGTLTLRNSIFDHNSSAAGGGILNEHGATEIQDSSFSDNAVTGPGGAVHITSGTLNVESVAFTNNSAESGGALYYNVLGTFEVKNSTFYGNSAVTGGAIATVAHSTTVTNSVFSNNSASNGGGGIYNGGETLSIIDSSFHQNSALVWGGGIANHLNGNLTISNSRLVENSAWNGGGISNAGSLTIQKTEFLNNSALSNDPMKDLEGGGGIYNDGGNLTIADSSFIGNTSLGMGGAISNAFLENSKSIVKNSTFSGNSASVSGGGISSHAVYVDEGFPSGTFEVINSTFSDNTAEQGGGAFNSRAILTVKNSTLSGNQALQGGAIYNDLWGGTLHLSNSILANSINLNSHETVEDCYSGADGMGSNIRNIVELNAVGDNTCGVPFVSADPALNSLANNGGFTQTLALLPRSPAINAGDDASCPAVDQRGVPRPQGTHCDIGAYETEGTIKVSIGGTEMHTYPLVSGESLRVSFSGVSNGPVKITDIEGASFMAAERVVYKVSGVNTSFTEMMGLPNSQIDTTYWLPWYNNATPELDTQLRFANVSGSSATVHVHIGGVEMTGSPFTLLAGESTRKSFNGINNGPVKIESNVNIVAAERVVYKAAGGIGTSFSEMMALPNGQRDTTYWLPWYNNATAELDTQLRFANASDSTATVHVYIGGAEMTGSPFTLGVGESTRKSFAGVSDGPVRIESDVPIVAAERVVYKAAGGVGTSFTEMMGLPAKQLDTTYWLPWYNNTALDTQLRFANVSNTTATVHVYIGGAEMLGSPFLLDPGASTRQSFAEINNGPVQIVSNVPIVAAERVVYKAAGGVSTSFSEMMALPNAQLDTTYWLPWYNNATAELDTQLRFGVP